MCSFSFLLFYHHPIELSGNRKNLPGWGGFSFGLDYFSVWKCAVTWFTVASITWAKNHWPAVTSVNGLV